MDTLPFLMPDEAWASGMGVSKFGSYLNDLRKAQGLTLSKAADLSGTSTSRLAEIERGMSYHTDHATRPSRELVK